MNTLVYLGRFQPFHNGHLSVILRALDTGNRVIVIIGTERSPRSVKNPFTVSERMTMITDCLAIRHHKNTLNLFVISQEDHLYSDATWISEIASKVDKIKVGNVNIIGFNKDSSSYYLNNFSWDFHEMKPDILGCDGNNPINATDIRNMYLETGHILESIIPASTINFLTSFKNTEAYANLATEYKDLVNYELRYTAFPYAVNFLTVDAVVIQNGNVLLIRRNGFPGKGSLALCGGHVNANEDCKTAVLRELREETCIKVPEKVLRGSMVAERLFDHPDRSLRCRVLSKKGRTISMAYVIKLNGVDNKLPEIRAGDDASEAMWVPFHELDNLELFEDHRHIIKWALSQI